MEFLRSSLSIALASPTSDAAPVDPEASGGRKPGGPIELLGLSPAPGEKAKFAYSQPGSFENALLDAVVFVTRGTRAGPNLCLSALVHGDERNGFEVARQTFAEVDP